LGFDVKIFVWMLRFMFEYCDFGGRHAFNRVDRVLFACQI